MIDITRIIKRIISTATFSYAFVGLLFANYAYAGTSVTYKNNDLGPFAAFSAFTQIGKYSYFLGEAEVGMKHQKIATTFTTFLGWNKEHGIKGTLQYMRQKPTVDFYGTNKDIWVQQGSLGLEYLYVYSNKFQLNGSGYYGFIPEETVTSNTQTTVNTILGTQTIQNTTQDKEIGKIVQGNQFGGWIGASYTPFKDTLFRAKLVCDFLHRDLTYDFYIDSVGDIQTRSKTLSSCGAGATIQFPMFYGFSFRFDTDYNKLQQKYNPELSWTPSFMDNMSFTLGGKIIKSDYEHDS